MPHMRGISTKTANGQEMGRCLNLALIAILRQRLFLMKNVKKFCKMSAQ
jgi:hypothetical protein